MSLKDRLKSITPPYSPYTVESWDGEVVYLRGLTIAEYKEHLPLLQDPGIDNAVVFAAIVCECSQDEDGSRVFDDPADIGTLPLDGLFDCYEEIMQRSSRRARVDEAKGN
jgi:hypothetical protein